MDRWREAEAQPLWKRLAAWMAVIWTASVAVIGLVAGALHLWIA